MKDKRDIFKFICGILIGGLIISFGVKSAGKNTQHVPKDDIRSLVKIYTSVGYGTGIIIEKNSEEMVIASNLHVISGWDEKAYVEFWDQKRVFGQQFGLDESYDVAFLSIPLTEFGEKGMEAYPSIEPEKSDVSEASDSDKIWTYDLFQDGSPVMVEGELDSEITYVYDMERPMLLGKMNPESVVEGMSGSGIFSKNGCYGILTAGNDEGVVAITPIDDIFKCLGSIPQ